MTAPTTYPPYPFLFDSHRYLDNPVAPGRWPVRATLHPMKSTAKAFCASSVTGPCSLLQPATQATRK
ncbi:hypothetical protein MRX96_010864 [Rhipicephalus microplus]